MVGRKACTVFLLIAIILIAECGRAQDAQSARLFLESVYGHYSNGGKGIDFSGPGAAAYFHSSLLKLIRNDIEANGPENVPAIDADPVCGCQDFDGIWDLKVDVALTSAERATARVTFFVFKRRGKDDFNQSAFTLAPEHGGWRIYDIRDESDPKHAIALRKLLADDIQQIRTSKPAQPAR